MSGIAISGLLYDMDYRRSPLSDVQKDCLCRDALVAQAGAVWGYPHVDAGFRGLLPELFPSV